MKTKLIVVLTGVAALTAACGSATSAAPASKPDTQNVARTSPVAPADSADSSDSSTSAGSKGSNETVATKVSTRPKVATGSGASTAPSGCPVTAATLLKALRLSPEYKAGDIAATKKLTGVDCAGDYAVALTAPEAADSLAVVFRYNGAKKSWKLISFGSDGFCDAVPAKVRPELSLCV